MFVSKSIVLVSLAYSFANAKLLKDYIWSILENNASPTVSEQASGVKSLSSLVPAGVILFKMGGEER